MASASVDRVFEMSAGSQFGHVLTCCKSLVLAAFWFQHFLYLVVASRNLVRDSALTPKFHQKETRENSAPSPDSLVVVEFRFQMFVLFLASGTVLNQKLPW